MVLSTHWTHTGMHASANTLFKQHCTAASDHCSELSLATFCVCQRESQTSASSCLTAFHTSSTTILSLQQVYTDRQRLSSYVCDCPNLSCRGFLRIGAPFWMSFLAMFFIHGSFSYVTLSGWIPDLSFPIYTDKINTVWVLFFVLLSADQATLCISLLLLSSSAFPLWCSCIDSCALLQSIVHLRWSTQLLKFSLEVNFFVKASAICLL